jgi:hypothetical protein
VSGNCAGQNSITSAATNLVNSSFDDPFPGQVGTRNTFRGPGYFGIDMALRKSWNITERENPIFTSSVYNITDSVRFDVFSALPAIDNAIIAKPSLVLT